MQRVPPVGAQGHGAAPRQKPAAPRRPPPPRPFAPPPLFPPPPAPPPPPPPPPRPPRSPAAPALERAAGSWCHTSHCECSGCRPSALKATAPPRSIRRAASRLICRSESTRLNSSHDQISYAVFCLKKKKIKE